MYLFPEEATQTIGKATETGSDRKFNFPRIIELAIHANILARPASSGKW
jgi:hypothetical protein